MQNLGMTSNHSSYTAYTAKQILRFFTSSDGKFWKDVQEKRSLELFHKAAKKVPAYKDFLRRHKIKPAKIRTYQDFLSVPPTDKKSYLQKYPFESLAWAGMLTYPSSISSTSGSTGKPFYFPRSPQLEWDSSLVHEMFIRNNFLGVKAPILVINCFGMGVWIGGLITYKAFQLVSERGYPISIISPGINKSEILKALRDLAPNFKQVIVAGYPPFVKDILDEAPDEGIDLKKLNIRLLFAAEAFTEKFRDYVLAKVDSKNICGDSMNIYGTADIGTMAFETPTSVLVRRVATKNQLVFSSLFSETYKTPTLAQYNPFSTNFESSNDELLITGNNTFPLIRYALGDRGGIFSYGTILDILKQHGTSFQQEAKEAKLEKTSLSELPFVYVYERVDLSTTIYGLQVYPETIRETLFDKTIERYLTYKFAMITKFDRKQNQHLEINFETRKKQSVPPHLKKYLLKKIVANLLEKNSEFHELHQHLGKRAYPKLKFWPAEHPLYFHPGTKQKWVIKPTSPLPSRR